MKARHILPVLIASGLFISMLVACDKKESDANTRLSGIGESCLRTADCVDGAQCIGQVCVAPGSSPSTASAPAPTPRPQAGLAKALENFDDNENGRDPMADESTEAQMADAVRDEACAQAAGFKGTWGFTTLGILANEPDKGGVNGYYTLDVTTVGADCRPRVTISKTGFAKHEFTRERYQVGESTLTPVQGTGPMAGRYLAEVRMQRPDGSAKLHMAFMFRFDGERLEGVWHYMADSWREMQMTGVLVGARNGGGRVSLPSIEAAGRQAACIASSCAPRPHGSAGFDCSRNYDDCFASRAPIAGFSPETHAANAAAAADASSSAVNAAPRSLDGLGRAITSALKQNDYAAYTRTLASMDFVNAAYAKGSPPRTAAERAKYEEELAGVHDAVKKLLQVSAKSWTDIRNAGERQGIVWSSVTFGGLNNCKVENGGEDILLSKCQITWLFRGSAYTADCWVFELRKLQRFLVAKMAWKG